MDEPQQNPRRCAQGRDVLMCGVCKGPGQALFRKEVWVWGCMGWDKEQGDSSLLSTWQLHLFLPGLPGSCLESWQKGAHSQGAVPTHRSKKEVSSGCSRKDSKQAVGRQRIKESKLRLLSTSTPMEGWDGERQEAIRKRKMMMISVVWLRAVRGGNL